MPNKMKVKFLAIVLLGFLGLPKLGSALAPADSATVTVSTSVRYYHESDFRDGNTNYKKPDSSLFQSDRVNQAADLRYNYLGVPGSAAQSLRYTDYSEILTRLGIRSYGIYFTSPDSIRYYTTNKKFTDINYHNGAFAEQVIEIIHTQNITKGWNAGITFKRFSVKDFMINSDTYNGEFVFFTSYHSNNGRYHAFLNGIWNSVENQVNGGLKNDSTYLYGDVDNVGIKSIGWKISDAQQRERNRQFHLSQFYDLGKKSTDSSGNSISAPALRLHHEISYDRNSLTYLDPTQDSSFYQHFYYSTNTLDSLHSDVMNNQFALILPADKRRKSSFFRNWSASAAANIQNVKYEQLEKLQWHNLSLEAKIISKYDSSDFTSTLFGQYVIDGKDQGNYRFSGEIKTKQYSVGSLGVKAEFSKRSPDFYMQFNQTNNYIWENVFTSINKSVLGVSYDLEKYRFSVAASRTTLDHAIYIDALAIPSQASNQISISEVSLRKDFVWRDLTFLNEVVFQKSDNENLVHLSPLYTTHSLYLRKGLFGKKLLTDFGVNAAFNDAYYADAFMPASGLFFNQYTLKSQGYLRVDLFIRTKIKSARIFLKMENIGDNIGKKSYFLVPHYAMPGQVFRFGVSWRFFDQ